uniref:DMT family transporter n=1 Tax=Pseudoxanthobacter sp. TaxID=1925742 RepID=UPI002FDF4E49
ATLLATLSPVWVVLGSRFFLGETVTRATLAGLGLCIAGAALLVGASFSVAPEHLTGDIYGLIVSAFFGSYVLSVRRLRQHMGAGELMYRSSIITAAGLLVVALAGGGPMWPASLSGLGALLAIALLSHVGGQGVTAFALGHLPAAFSSLVIFLEALAAAATGYVVFGESMTALQMTGAAMLVAGIVVARPRRARRD